MQMRWRRHGVKLTHWVVRLRCPIDSRIGAIAFDGSVNMANANERRSERALAFR
jgi:hypothetical protein